MQVKDHDEAVKDILDYAKRIQTLQKQRKEIDEDIKSVKQEAKEDGVAIGKVMKALGILMKEAKENEADKVELEIIKEHLASDEDIQNNIAILNG